MRERDVAIADRLPQAEREMLDRERAIGEFRQRARGAATTEGFARTAEMFEQSRHGLIRIRRKKEIDRGQALIIHAPAVMHMMVDRDLDHLGRMFSRL